MLQIQIPGREMLTLSHLVLDYNGTIAKDGEILAGVRPRLAELAKDLAIYIITADTHGTAAGKCEGLPLQVLTFPTTEVGEIKAEEVRKLSGGVVAVGNGKAGCPLSGCGNRLLPVRLWPAVHPHRSIYGNAVKYDHSPPDKQSPAASSNRRGLPFFGDREIYFHIRFIVPLFWESFIFFSAPP